MGRYIRFDWAIKRLLRDKANYVVLEGFLTTLLEKKITIRKMLESEGNQEDEFDKQNRVDMLAETGGGELILIEVQTTTYTAYFQRMLYGVSKLVTEYMHKGDDYGKVRKVYSINIVYFPLGAGTDYAYRGTTDFIGLHDKSPLLLTELQQQKFGAKEVSDIYPIYYILKVNDFDKVAKTPLDEWIAYLKTGDIAEHCSAPGLPEARVKMEIDKMSPAARERYNKHLDEETMLKGTIDSGYESGRFDGFKEGQALGYNAGVEQGQAAGERKAKQETAKRLLAMGMTAEQAAQATGLKPEDI